MVASSSSKSKRKKKAKPITTEKQRAHLNGSKLNKVELQLLYDSIIKYKRDTKMLLQVLPFCKTTIYKYLNDFKWTPSGRKRGTGKSTSPQVLEIIDYAFKELPSLKLCELKQIIKDGLKLTISTSQISSVKRQYLFITYKRCEKIAKYRATDRVQALRKIYRQLIIKMELEQLFFIDESHLCLDHVVRVNGHSAVNTPCLNICHRVSGKRYSLLACINYSHGWFYHEFVDTTKKAIDARRFQVFFENLVRRLPVDAIIVMDNASVHKSDEIKEVLYRSGIRHVFQSPYSPDYNPIEYCFGWIKKELKNYEFSTEPLPILLRYVLNDLNVDLVRSFCRFSQKHWHNENKI